MNGFAALLPPAHSKLRFGSIIVVSFIVVMVALMSNPLIAHAVDSTPVTAGFRDFAYPVGTGGDSSPTGEKPESKLWWNDGLWWGILWSTAGNAYHIYQLNWTTQTWLDTGVAVDDRNASRADALWDGQQLYVVSHIFTANAGQAASAGQRGELYRYTYDAGTKNYSLDSGYPVEITGGKSETLVLDKDTTGRLWVTYVESQKVMVNHSLNADNQWGAPYVLPATDATGLNSDDIASLISFGGRVGVMWSNHTTQKMYFATHLDSAQDSVWQSVSIYAPSGAAADDHINLKSLQTDSAGSVFAVLKTSFSAATSPLINLLVCASGTGCTAASNWQPYVIYKKQDHHTRAILLIDTTNRTLNVFSTTPEAGGTVYRKSTGIDNIQFATGHGTPFIQSATDTTINNSTSTKQNVNSTTGLVVLASDANTHYYLHNYLSLTNAALPTLAFSNVSYSVAENGGTATVTVNLSTASSQSVTVNYATGNGTATAGSDYSTTNGTLTFAPGETSKTFAVPILQDTLVENNETINLALSTPGNATLGVPATATLTIMDDDSLPTAQFSPASYSVAENVGNATITVMLNKVSASAVTVNYATSNGTATTGSDYSTTSGTLTFAPGETSKPFTVPILDDTLDENDETINVALSSPTNAVLGVPATATLTIVDNDNPPTVQFNSANYSVNESGGTAIITATLGAPSGLPVTVNYATSNGTATAASDYTAASGVVTFNAGQTSKTLMVSIAQDMLVEGNETINLALTAPNNATLGTSATATLTIIDDDIPPTVQFSSATYSVNENGGTATVTAMLSNPSGLPVTVSYATSNGMATAGSDYIAASDTLTFAPGQTTKTFAVSILQDTLDENDEAINLALTTSGKATLGALATATLTIIDDDTPPTVQFSSATYSVNENGGIALITAMLSVPSSLTVNVNYATSNGMATAGSDYATTSGALTFAPGETSQTFTVSILEDLLDENNETLDLALSAPNNAILGTPSVATLTIVNDDNPPTVQFSAAIYSVNEQGSPALVTATLSAASGMTVTVRYGSSNGTATADNDYTAVNEVLTFSPGETSKTFVVPVLTDNQDESDETVHLALSNPTQASLGAPSNAVLTILDANTALPAPTVQFSTSTYQVDEQAGVATITVTLSAASNQAITLKYATSNATATADGDYTATVGSLAFTPGEIHKTFMIPIADDATNEDAETVNLALSDPSNATLGAPVNSVLTIIDNDAPPIVQFSTDDYVYGTNNSGSEVMVEVRLNAASGKLVTVNYVISKDSITEASLAASGTLTFNPGETSKSFGVPISPDDLTGTGKTFTLTLSSPMNANLGTATVAMLSFAENNQSLLFLPLVIR